MAKFVGDCKKCGVALTELDENRCPSCETVNSFERRVAVTYREEPILDSPGVITCQCEDYPCCGH